MQNKKTILITGANGQLGKEFGAIAPLYEDNFTFIFVSKQDLPIDDFIALECFFDQNKIDFCVNCAAYTAVDKAETEIELAYLINETSVANLATLCHKHHAKLIHISTDYVFDGTATSPITEKQKTNPLGVYGASKLKGEEAAIQNNPSTLLIRTSWVYSSFGNNFVKTMIRLMNEKESINVVSDQIGRPTYARDLANTIVEIINSWQDEFAGVYNFSNTGDAISWYDFASAIKESIESKCIVNPIPSSAYPTPAKRPSYSVLNTTKLETQFYISIPSWKDSLERCMQVMSN
jgi:dTDP-4-dehydrorhamnose reductase